ncbi:subtilisin-like protein [Coprinopsis marcescibilis]|uniref:Subtilisin-like protein n=1 Tax=Coprinopsis marcescibilis TaxID=230819 RepID=A0A5C3LAQ5_COPMA|nr:subtilisin-like protein [Coprinopsis marcescibilis]
MRFNNLFTTLYVFLVANSALAIPAALSSVETYSGEVNGKYIVQLKPGVSRKDWVSKLQLSKDTVEWDLINGFSAQLTENALNALRASGDVVVIAEDGYRIVNEVPEEEPTATLHDDGPRDVVKNDVYFVQRDAPWGLERISQPGPLSTKSWDRSTFRYSWNEEYSGTGVDIFIIDSGIWREHSDFKGRVRFGVNTYNPNVDNTDGVVTGTFTASSAAGDRWGVAKKANIVNVIAFYNDAYDKRHGTISQMISALDWVAQEAKQTKRPAVAHIHTVRGSGYGPSTPLDNAAASLVESGVHVVIGAGDDKQDIANSSYPSPARVPSVITVAASDINDSRADYSNFGVAVTLFAPGAGIQCADFPQGWGGNDPYGYTTRYGSSQASSYVSGIIAHLISKEGNVTPTAMKSKLVKLAVKDALGAVPTGTPNLLAQLGPL